MSPTPTPASGAWEPSSHSPVTAPNVFSFEATSGAGVVTDTCIIPVIVELARCGGDFITGWHFPARKICFWWDIFLAAPGIGSWQISGRTRCCRSLWASHICMCVGGQCLSFSQLWNSVGSSWSVNNHVISP